MSHSDCDPTSEIAKNKLILHELVIEITSGMCEDVSNSSLGTTSLNTEVESKRSWIVQFRGQRTHEQPLTEAKTGPAEDDFITAELTWQSIWKLKINVISQKFQLNFFKKVNT